MSQSKKKKQTKAEKAMIKDVMENPDIQEYRKRIVSDLIEARREYTDEIKFYKEEWKKANAEIERLEKLKHSYAKSFCDSVVKANSKLYMINSEDIEDDFDKNGFKNVGFRIEQLRHFFFKDYECEKLRAFNCIGVERQGSAWTSECKIRYMFYNGKDHFSIRIPYKNDFDHACTMVFHDQNGSFAYNPFHLGTIEVVLHYSKDNDIYNDNVKVVESFDINEIRDKLAEAVEDDFKALKEEVNKGKQRSYSF